jgi:hypothetical protein
MLDIYTSPLACNRFNPDDYYFHVFGQERSQTNRLSLSIKESSRLKMIVTLAKRIYFKCFQIKAKEPYMRLTLPTGITRWLLG